MGFKWSFCILPGSLAFGESDGVGVPSKNLRQNGHQVASESGIDSHLSECKKCDTWEQPISSRFWNGPPHRPEGQLRLPNIGYNGDLVVVKARFLHKRLQTLRVVPIIGCTLSTGGKARKHQGALQRGMVLTCSSLVHHFWSPCLHQSINRVR